MPASPKPNKLNTLNNSRTRPTPGASTSPVPSVPSAAPPPPAYDGRCQHRRTDGKRCASPTYPGHASLCHHHLSRQMRGISDGDIVAADILSSIGNFQSAAAINIALGKLFVHQITGRIARQDALALAYNCQLLLRTLPEVKTEHRESGYIKAWREETNRILSGPSDLEALTAPSLLPELPHENLSPQRRGRPALANFSSYGRFPSA